MSNEGTLPINSPEPVLTSDSKLYNMKMESRIVHPAGRVQVPDQPYEAGGLDPELKSKEKSAIVSVLNSAENTERE